MLDFLCIGAQKAGTTWLSSQLECNPGIWLHPFKELHCFDHLYYPAHRAWTLRHLQQAALERVEGGMMREGAVSRFDYIAFLVRCADREWAFTEAWYRHAFTLAPKERRRGECTPGYAGIGAAGVAHVRRLMPDVRIIYLIRDPVQRAWSQIRMNVARAGNWQTGAAPDQALLLSEAKKPEIWERGNYAANVADWERAFGSGRQIHYVPYRRIAENPADVHDLVERHIAVEHSGRRSIEDRVNASLAMAMSASLAAYLREKLAPQYAFLQRHFGTEFVAQI